MPRSLKKRQTNQKYKTYNKKRKKETIVTIDDEETETESEGEDLPRRRLIRSKMSELSDSISRKEPLERALELLTERTYIRHGEYDHDYHQACVCLICDRIIKGTDEIKFVRKTTILKNEHVLSIDYFNKSTNMAISPALQQQYQINDTDLQHLLLSPRSRRKNDRYICCNSCARFMQKGKAEKAPKFAIFNGFAIGQIPDSIKNQLGDKEISDILAAMISKYRFLIYVFCYYGGAHKAIKGHHTFLLMIQSTLEQHLILWGQKIGVLCTQ